LDTWYSISPSSSNKKVRLTGFATGHLWWWQHEEASVLEKHILDEYGTVARWNGTLGVRFFLEMDRYTDVVGQEQRLWVADPKAIHHILQNSSLVYEKPSVNRELLAALTDDGIATAKGELPLILYGV
jgi:hypothetical protein